MDFIVKLFKSKNIIIEINYNNILIIINKFIKYFYFIPYNEIYGVK